MYLTATHYQDLLDKLAAAQLRLADGAKMVTVNGQQYQFEDMAALQRAIDAAELKIAELAGTDGRGAWEAAFSE